MLEMTVHGVNLDVVTNQPVLILKDKEGKKFLPIWIGQFEATAILLELQGVKSSRPLTHDLLKNMIEELEGDVQKIVINDIDNGTFYARIHIQRNKGLLEVDARPSDAIALAVRIKVPIFAADKVIERATVLSDEGEEEEISQFKHFLENIAPEDFSDEAN